MQNLLPCYWKNSIARKAGLILHLILLPVILPFQFLYLVFLQGVPETIEDMCDIPRNIKEDFLKCWDGYYTE
jgi:hypothetical protein